MQSFYPGRHLFGPNMPPSLTAVTFAPIEPYLLVTIVRHLSERLAVAPPFAIITQQDEALRNHHRSAPLPVVA